MDEQSSLEFVRSLSRSTHLGPIITAGLAKAVDTMKQEASKLRGAHDAMEALSKALTKTEQERDDLSKRLERMHRPRCDGYSDDPKGPWPLLENPCQFCGARSESDACRDMSDTADCDKIRAQRDVALAEVERLTKERVIFTARSRTVSMDEAREMFPDSDPKQQASG